MKIPEYVLACLNRLEEAGFAAYIVGGCVRDNLLGLTPNDYDMCTNALPDQTEEIFSDHKLVLAGKKHGTVGVITEGGVVEITTFRTEGNYTDNRHPEWVEFVPNIEDDLARRDFTVNAMAYSPTRGLADPFGGQEDLKNKILRAVGDAEQRFREDSLRILRGARFAAKYELIPEEKTLEAMISLRGLMKNLARERVFEELCKLLLSATAEDLPRWRREEVYIILQTPVPGPDSPSGPEAPPWPSGCFPQGSAHIWRQTGHPGGCEENPPGIAGQDLPPPSACGFSDPPGRRRGRQGLLWGTKPWR